MFLYSLHRFIQLRTLNFFVQCEQKILLQNINLVALRFEPCIIFIKGKKTI